jgi:hypothetical protein
LLSYGIDSNAREQQHRGRGQLQEIGQRKFFNVLLGSPHRHSPVLKGENLKESRSKLSPVNGVRLRRESHRRSWRFRATKSYVPLRRGRTR